MSFIEKFSQTRLLPTITFEIELTNYCNFSCVFCNNSITPREKGFMNFDFYSSFIYSLSEQRDKYLFNKFLKEGVHPKIVFGGQGEPLLHTRVTEFIKLACDLGFKTQLISNGSHLNLSMAKELINAGLSNIAISLHSLNEKIFKEITGNDLSIILPDLVEALDYLLYAPIEVEIWRVKHPNNEMQEDLEDRRIFDIFCNQYPRFLVLGPSEPWSRDGRVESVCDQVGDYNIGGVWCNKILFNNSISWDGFNVLCCVDYNRITVPLGNSFLKHDDEKVHLRKMEILENYEMRPYLCKLCKRWRDTTDEKYISSFRTYYEQD